MNCLDVRRTLQAEPRSGHRGLAGHLEGCAACRAVAGRLLALDSRLRVALAESMPAGLAERVLLRHAAPETVGSRRLTAAVAAASLLVLMVAGALLHRSASSGDRAIAAIDHVANEPAALLLERSIDEVVLRNALAAQGLVVRGPPGRITYRAPCPTPDGPGEHFVVRSTEGVVTLILDRRRDVDRDPDSGAARGLFAVVVRGLSGNVSVVAATRELAMAYAARLRPLERPS